MTGDRAQLAALVRLTEAAFLAQQGKLGALLNHEAELRQRLAVLAAQGQARSAVLAAQVSPSGPSVGPPDDDPALRMGVDTQWLAWIDSRRLAINMRLARCIAAQAAEHAALAEAFGKRQAARALAQKTDAERRRRAARRAEEEG